MGEKAAPRAERDTVPQITLCRNRIWHGICIERVIEKGIDIAYFDLVT
jgi:hypothetical protein